MKRLSTIIMALALVLGMSQCKKQETPTNGNGGEKVYVTLNVSNGESLDVNVNDNGGRHAVAPNLGVIQFRNGDTLYVGNSGRYIGKLAYQNGAFGGTLNDPSGDDYLHFYFVGNAALSEALPETIEEGTAEITSRTISIDNQSQNLPVLCYGHSSQPYTATATNYSAVLEYKCALVRFNLQNQVYMNVNLSNVLTEATIDFANNAITPITTSTGTMTLYGEEGVITHRWGILLPGTTLTGNSDLEWQGTGSMPTIVANGYVDAGVGKGILIKNPSIEAPTTNAVVNSAGALSVFSVSPTKKVYFSKANLKYTPGSTAYNGTWGFHDSQVDECYGVLYRPNNYKAYRPMQSKYKQAWVGGSSSSMDRFCWGYNGYTIQGETDYISGRKDLSRTLETDWGCAFPNTYWRTPTASEWDYLLKNTARGNKRFMMVKFVYRKTYPGDSREYQSWCNGLMLFPDNFDESGLQLSSNFDDSWYNQTDAYHAIDGASDFYDDPGSNMYKLLNAGVVFLPAVGMRAGGIDNYGTHTSSDYYIYDYYDAEAGGVAQGYYWTASCDGYETWSKYLWIGVTGGRYYANGDNTANATETFGVGNTMENVPRMREIGMCVRLVWDAN